MSISKLPLKKKIALGLHARYKRNSALLHTLNYIFWECTLKCNLSCLHCGSDCKMDISHKKDMQVADFIGAIDQIQPIVEPNTTMIVFTGGEPLLRHDLEIAGLELYKRGFPWGMVTNGLALSPKRLESLLASGLHAVTVSLDGMETSHNWLRGNNKSFKKAFAAVKMLAKTDDIIFDVVTCVNRRNFEELSLFRDMLIDTGVKEWRIFTIFPIGRAKENDQLQLNAVEFYSLFEFIKQTRKEGKIKVNYGCEGYLGSFEGEVRDNFFSCNAGINIASVLADGSISACPNLRENFIQGNIYRDNFADIWTNRYEKYRNRSWTKTGICANCSSYKYCEGNGLHLRDESTGELLFCHLKRIEEGEKIVSCS